MNVISNIVGDYFVFFSSSNKVIAMYAHNDNIRPSGVFSYLGGGRTEVENIGRLSEEDCVMVQEYILRNYKDLMSCRNYDVF